MKNKKHIVATMERIQLPYTLDTYVGMVTNNGLPASHWVHGDTKTYEMLEKHNIVTLPRVSSRADAHDGSLKERMRHLITNDNWRIGSFQDYAETNWFHARHSAIPETAIACLRTNRVPNDQLIRGSEADKRRFVANVAACRNRKIDIHRLMTFMKNRSRLNLEQAAAAVVSAFVNDNRLADAEVLLRELTGVLAVSQMSESWNMAFSRNTLAKGAAEAFAHAAEKAHIWCSKAVERQGELPAEVPRNYRDFVQLLLRVRSVRPRTKDRCLYIPRWMFEAAGIEPAGGHAVHLNGYETKMEEEGQLLDVLRGYKWPENPAGDDSIVLSKHMFRILQRSIFRLYHFWDPVVKLRHRVRALEDEVLYASAWIDKQLRETDDVAKVAFWFFAYQRRLQLKVVSDDRWTRFLAKGEGSLLYQNSLRLKSTFEQALAHIAGLELDSLTKGGVGDTLGLIDEACLLMKEYVDVYGQGRKENLVFQKGASGGRGRGAVDEYNMLCVILRDLKSQAKEDGIEDLPGPVYKFLAKDILSWNKSWDDDAFANGKVHGWEEWVVKRGLV
ncbi:hypothetical protein CONLIGDRAFT_502271 [Coniochaeta ligniaria NRRL 30616]|uniref:Uncharacterized protein n=1 Tax=Coniochaeta ligniaria NRRL 30616 TaxID=1408157 RepID=A0A1J7JDK0_9PEZI|nr:hypothetical protein CONLIGDRAFT_502271 [Coniochaeta ligniaria NRRL 30616]